MEHSQLPIQWVNKNPLRGIQLAWRKAEHFYPLPMLRMQKGNPVIPYTLMTWSLIQQEATLPLPLPSDELQNT
jgi:hypothetical protein